MSPENSDPFEPPASLQGTALLRAVAETIFKIRHALEHGDVTEARHAARHLVVHLDALPADRAAYERLCDEADRELAQDPAAWDRRET